MSSLSINNIIVTVPSGVNLGLTADTINMREGNFEVLTVNGVDVGTIVVDAAAHIAATSGVHGVTGNVVGTIDVQVLSNKSITTTSSIVDSVDNTKRISFDVSGAVTGTTTTFVTTQTGGRVITFPDITDTVVTENAVQELANKSLRVPSTKLIDDLDATKRITFDTSAAAGSTHTTFMTGQSVNRMITFPDATDTVTLNAATQTLTNKTLTLPVIASISNGGTVTIPTGPTTLVGTNTADVLTNKLISVPSSKLADDSDTTKRVSFDASGATTGRTTTFTFSQSIDRTIAVPNATDTMTLNTAVQTLTNKTLTLPTIASLLNVGLVTIPTGPETLVGRATTDTLTNKTLTLPIIASIFNGGTVTIPTGPETLVGRATTDTLTNKTLTLPVIASISNGGTVTIPTGPETLVGRATTDTLTNKTLTLPIIASISNGGTVTIPTGPETLVGRATTDTLTNKTLTTPTINSPVLTNSGNTLTLPTITTTLVGTNTTDTLTNKLISMPSCNLASDANTSRRVTFDISAASDITTTTFNCSQSIDRVITVPDTTDTMTLNDFAQTLTNKAIDSASNTVLVNGTNINSLINQDVRTTAGVTFNTIALTNVPVSTYGLTIDQVAGASTANGIKITAGGTDRIAITYNGTAGRTNIHSIVDTELQAGSSVRMLIPSATASPATIYFTGLDLDGSDVKYTVNSAGGLQYVTTAGTGFSSSATGNINMRVNSSSQTLNLGVGSSTAQLQVANTATTITSTLVVTNTPSSDADTTGLSMDGGGLVHSRGIQSGLYSSTFGVGTFSDFSGGISQMIYSRNGNIVTCSFVFDTVLVANAASNVGTATIPISRSSNFTTAQQAAGVISFSANPTVISYANAFVRATTGTTDKIDIVVLGVSGGGDVTIIGNFQYTLA